MKIGAYLLAVLFILGGMVAITLTAGWLLAFTLTLAHVAEILTQGR